jgi:uncharacterized membrane protein
MKPAGVSTKSARLLLAANGLLLLIAWVMAFVAYPRLPESTPLWLNFSGQSALLVRRSLLFFIYPAAQTAFVIVFWFLSRITMLSRRMFKEESPAISPAQEKAFRELKKEFVALVLLFFNLIFIHLQRSLILLAHRLERGVDPVYFYTLFGVILILIPYYRLRAKLLGQKMK